MSNYLALAFISPLQWELSASAQTLASQLGQKRKQYLAKICWSWQGSIQHITTTIYLNRHTKKKAC